MLLMRSLPPQFLLPAWSAHQLAAVQRAYNSTDSKEQRPDCNRSAVSQEADELSSTQNDRVIPIRRAIGRPARYKSWQKVQSKPQGGDEEESHIQGREGFSNEIPLRPQTGVLQSWPPITLSAQSAKPPTPAARMAAEEKDPPNPQPAEPKPKPPKKTEAMSLFDQLFPEERHRKSPEQRMAELRFDKLPAFKWTPEINIGDLGEEQDKPNLANQIPRRDLKLSNKYTPPGTLRDLQRSMRKSEKGVLVLNACSKTLEESDFFRISPKGQHIEGWKSGLLKVIPTRDNITLEPLGSYFLIFNSPAAARAYLDQTMRLHTLARLRRKDKEARFPLPPGYLKEGEDLEDLIKGFSLIPGFVKLSLRMLSRPYSPRVERLVQEGGPAAIAGREAGAEHMVLFTTDRSHITHADVGGLLKQDGKRRNLRWNVATTIQESIVRLQNKIVEDLTPQPMKGRAFGAGTRKFNGSERFLISFKDSQEARRFVREWHCRPLPMQQTRRAEDEPPPIVNAEMLW